MTIDVTIGKYTVVFPFLNTISPGSFPMKLQRTPTIINIIPMLINILPKSVNFVVPPFENAYKPFQ